MSKFAELGKDSAPPNGEDVLGVIYKRISEIPAKPIKWLWPGKFAKGKISIIAGNPGVGKSQVCASMASIVSNGGQWPVDRSATECGSVIILSAEDDVEDTIRPRLEAAGADIDKIYILQAIRYETESGTEESRGFNLLKDAYRLGDLMMKIGDVALVIIDPITAYMGAVDSHRNAEVRSMLAPLQVIAAASNAAIIAVSHLTKAQGVEALQRIQGSIAFSAAARAVWGVVKDKDNPHRRLFLQLKNNLSTDDTGLAYALESFVLEGSEPPIGTSHVVWEDAKITMSADEAFSSIAKDFTEHSEIEDAKDFLRSLLVSGPMKALDIERDAKGAGHSWSTVRRAQRDMKIESYKDNFKGPWFWRLPGLGYEDDHAAQHDERLRG